MARVLIVDDEQSIRKSLRALVEMDGHEVSLASDADEALKLLQEGPFDVVVTDIILPRKTGVALLADIREVQPDLPVIMITGDPGVETAAEAVRRGAFDYLSKPVSRADISRTVSAAIGKKTLLDKNRQLEEENRNYREHLEGLVEERTAQLKEMADQLQVVTNNSADHIILLDLDEKIRFMNRPIPDLMEADVLGRSLCDFVGAPEFCQAATDCLRRVRETGKPDGYETEYRIGEGETRHFSVRVAPVVRSGEVVAFVSSSSDITDRKQAEEKEREHYKNIELLSATAIRFVDFPEDEDIYRYIGERIRELAGESIVSVNSINEAGDVLTNRVILGLGKIASQVASLMGRNPEGITLDPQGEELHYLSDRKLHDSNKRLYTILQKAVPKPICAALEKLYDIGKIYTMGFAREDRLLGTAVIFLSKGQVLRSPEAIETFVNQASIALQRKQTAASLQTSEARFRTFFENQPALCYMISPQATVLDVNETALNVLGYQKSELVGKPVSMIYASESAQRHPELVAQWKETGRIRDEEMTIVSKSGQEHVVVLSADTVQDSKGHILHSISVQLDITKRKEAEQRQQHLLDNIIESVSMMTQVRDPYTAGHQKRVTQLACAIGEKLQMGEEQTIGLRAAALLHDIGKLSIPAEILSKPARLTDVEFQLIKAHVNVGVDILREIEFPWPIADIVLQHHERLDGSGYPHGIREEDGILLEARIIAVADVVEAMSSHRPYRPSLGIPAALEEIGSGSGTKYDKEVVTACLAVFEDGFQF